VAAATIEQKIPSFFPAGLMSLVCTRRAAPVTAKKMIDADAELERARWWTWVANSRQVRANVLAFDGVIPATGA
jgi:hypothetical protein